MKRIARILGTATLIAALAPLGVTAASAHHGGHDGPDRIDLPDGWQPEGVTTDGHALYAGSLVNGAIFKADPRSGKGEVLAEGRDGWSAVGIDYDKRRDLIWAAGGATNKIRAYDADTGKVVATYDFPSATPRFLNDLVVTDKGVFATDSSNQELAVVPFQKHGGHGHGKHGRHHDGRHHDRDGHQSLPPASAAKVLPLTGDVVYQAGFNFNGIAVDHEFLLAVQSNTGELFKINPCNGRTDQVDLGGATVVNGDGLEVDNHTAYVVRNQNNLVAVVDLDRHATSGEVVDEITDAGLDVPASATIVRGSLWVVNARFNTPPTADTPYWLTRLDIG